MRFEVGQRVMVSRWSPSRGGQHDDYEKGMNGYYGYVTQVAEDVGKQYGGLVYVALIGRVGAPAREEDLAARGSDLPDEWPLFADELEHAD